MKTRSVLCMASCLLLSGAVLSGTAQSTVLYTENFDAWPDVPDNLAQYTNDYAVTTTSSGGTWSSGPGYATKTRLDPNPPFGTILQLERAGNDGGMSSVAIALDPSLFTQGAGRHKLSMEFLFANDPASRLWAEVWNCDIGSGGAGNYYQVPNVIWSPPVSGFLPIVPVGDASASLLAAGNWGGGLAGTGTTVVVDFTYDGTGDVVVRLGGGRAAGNGWAAIRADNLVLTHEAGPIILTQPQDQAVLLGATGTVLSVEAEGEITSYQWLLEGGAISAATGQTYALPTVGFAETGSYSVVVSDATGPSTSEVAQVTIVPAPITPGSQSVLAGQTVTFSVDMPDAGTSYQWTQDGTNLVGETGPILSLPSVSALDEGTYQVVTGLGGDSVDSETATLSVFPATVDVLIENWDFETPSSTNPINDVEGWLEQEDQVFSVRIQRPALAGGVNQVLRLGYAWDSVNLRQSLPAAFRGDLDYTLSFDVFGSTDINGGAGTGAATDYYVTFNDPGGAGLVLRVDLTTPAAPTTVNVALPACVAKIADERGMQLRFNKGDTRPNGVEHFVWIDNVTLTAVAAAPEVCIGRQPADQNLVLGAEEAAFSVVAAGAEPLSYQWYRDGTPVGAGDTLVVPTPGNADEGDYWVVVSNAFNTVTSEVAVLNLTVGSMTPVWQRAFSGAPARISVGMLPGVTGYNYAWKKDGVLVPGASDATLVVSCLEPGAGGLYTAVVSLNGSSVESWNSTLVVLPPPSDYAAAVLADGPIAYWRLGEASGTVAAEAVSGRNGFYQNGVQLGVPGALVYDADTAASFIGAATSLVEVTDGSTLSPAVFSVEFWALVTGGSGTREAVANMDVFSNQSNGGWAFRPISGGSWQFRIVQAANSVSTVTAPASDGQWHHIVGAYDGTNQTLYVNGFQVGSVPTAYVPQSVAVVPLRIGSGGANADTANPAFFFVGTVDEVAVYDRALTLSEVQTHYANGEAPTYLCMEQVGGTMQLSWPLGVLQTNDSLEATGGWTDVPGAISPYAPLLNGPQNNYRVRVPVP